MHTSEKCLVQLVTRNKSNTEVDWLVLRYFSLECVEHVNNFTLGGVNAVNNAVNHFYKEYWYDDTGQNMPTQEFNKLLLEAKIDYLFSIWCIVEYFVIPAKAMKVSPKYYAPLL